MFSYLFLAPMLILWMLNKNGGCSAQIPLPQKFLATKNKWGSREETIFKKLFNSSLRGIHLKTRTTI